MLWIGLHLPLLSLETVTSLLAPGPPGALAPFPLALTDGPVVVHANRAARALGVVAGLKRATALALAPQLVLAQADPARDAAALQAVAHAALAFTPSVSLVPPQTVLLEVQASLRYFGGLERLLLRLRAALRPLGHRLWLATAPTAQGAALMCRRVGLDAAPPQDGRRPHELHCADLATLTEHLEAAPVWLLGPGREHWEALEGMGLRTVGDLRRLPRAGVARRFGEALLHELDRALGQRPDPRNAIELPACFDSRLELLARADTTEQVLHGARVLLARLVVWVAARQARVSRFKLVMQHEARHRSDTNTPPASELEIALAEPSCDADHLQLLLRERLARVQLVAPTLDLALHCDALVQRAPPNAELFPTAQNEREGLTRLIERLQARLGGAQVQRLAFVEDHRPERSSVMRPLEGGWPPAGREARPPPLDGPPRQQPVWLLPTPEPLTERDRHPLLDGRPLQLLCGPERIESGWWDAGLVERDYFIAQAADGALVWIFRGRLPLRAEAADEAAGWFLHGRFA